MNASPALTCLPPLEDDYGERVAIAIMLCLVSLLGIVGNTLTIFSVVACRKLQTLPNAFVVSLSLSDFLNCSVNIPIQVTALTHPTASLFNVVCVASAVLNYVLITCSVSMLDLIAINRFILITKSHNIYQFIYTKRNMVVTISGVWISTIVVLIALGPTKIVHYGYNQELSLCQLKDESPVIDVICGILFAASFIIVSFCYVKIYFHVRRHLRQVAHIRQRQPSRPTPSSTVQTNSTGSGNISNIVTIETTDNQYRDVQKPDANEEDNPVDETENRITMNMIIIVVCFFLCVLPTLAIVLIPGTQAAGRYTVLFLYSASCCNPIIYGWKHPVFRKAFKCIFSGKLSDIEEPSPWLRSLLAR